MNCLVATLETIDFHCMRQKQLSCPFQNLGIKGDRFGTSTKKLGPLQKYGTSTTEMGHHIDLDSSGRFTFRPRRLKPSARLQQLPAQGHAAAEEQRQLHGAGLVAGTWGGDVGWQGVAN